MKISKIKKKNHQTTKLSKQGKLKGRRHNKKKHKVQKVNIQKPIENNEDVLDTEDLIDMIDKDDFNYTNDTFRNNSYNLYRSKRNTDNENKDFEEQYEKTVFKSSENLGTRDVRFLLPIKTKDGEIKKQVIEKDNEEVDNHIEVEKSEAQEDALDDDELNDMDSLLPDTSKPIPTVQLLACREEKLKLLRYRIGVLSSEVLENPEQKINNLHILLNMMEERNPEVYVTTRKLATASLLEIFKDLLPSYNIFVLDKSSVKLKKETLQLQTHEALILKYYKQYLQKLEKMGNAVRNKKGSAASKNHDLLLGIFSISCMSNLLANQPYFNFSSNIANFLVPFLNSKIATVRDSVAKSFVQIFKEDKRGELSLIIVRRLNQYIKLHKHVVHIEVTSVLLSLPIKNINLDKEKEDENKYKKKMSHKQRILSLSKRERKKKNKLQQVEKEMLEMKAEESKNAKHKVFTEITSLLFTIYFRILKEAPNSYILSSCLEGLSKFSHCINIDFYQDLISALDKLLNECNLSVKDRLHCIHATFVIISGQASILNIDPTRFYTHLYNTILDIHIGKDSTETSMIIKALVQVLVYRYKSINQNRLLAFVKRIATIALNFQHNTTLGIINIIRLLMQNCKTTSILLDTDCNVGDGIYLPELNDPEYCNAYCTSLWELVALQRHYHSTVQNFAKSIAEDKADGESHLSLEILKLSPEDIYNQYDPSEGIFNPIIPLPKATKVKNIQNCIFTHKFSESINDVNIENLFENKYFDIFKDLKMDCS